MSRTFVRWTIWLGGLFVLAMIAGYVPAAIQVQAQQPTGSIPTVTGTPIGPRVTVNLDQDFVNVRSGPSSFFYPRIGILMRGQAVPALGRSVEGNWIQIEYYGVPGNVGWVFGANVTLSGGSLPFVDAPPTPTPQATPTINPTLAAAFITPVAPTGLATFTPAAAVEVPVFTDVGTSAAPVPVGLLIFGFGVIGLMVAVVSLLRGR